MRTLLVLVALLQLLSFVTASITLGTNFQPFSGTASSDSSAIDSCRALYNSRIEACTDSVDFLSGHYCTSGCQQALNLLEVKLNNFCQGVVAPSGSLLAAVFSRKLVASVCRDGGATGPQSSTRVSTTTKAVKTTTMQTLVSSSGTADGEATTTAKVSASSSITVTLSTSTNTATSSSTATTFSLLPTPTTLVSSPTTTTLSYREKARQEEACAILQGGGGSPFDNMSGFHFPSSGRDRQQRLRECEGIKSAKSGGGKLKAARPSGVVACVLAIGVGLMVLV